MRLVISDIQDLQMSPSVQQHRITDHGGLRPCIGCFGCWIRTPGQCILKDGYEDMGKLLGHCDELFLISRCTFGSYSPFVKNILDRSISYISPNFVMRSGEMHHRRRYDNVIRISACFYGEDITPAEEQTARSLVAANALNFDSRVGEVLFFRSAGEVKAALSNI